MKFIGNSMYNYLTKVIKPLFFLLFIVNTATAAPLANFKSNDLEIELSSEADGIFRLSLISLSKTKQITDPTILELENPYRLVLDLPGFASKSSKTINVSSAFISALRMGAHADKVRFVIDIKANLLPEYQITKDVKTNTVSLEFVFAETSALFKKISEDRKKEEKVSKQETISETTTTSISTTISTIKSTSTSTLPSTTITTTTNTTTTSTLPPLKQQATTTIPTISSTTIAVLEKEEPVAGRGGAELKSIFFQITENTRLPAVSFEVPGLKSYALNKITEELYELVLDNSFLKGKYLELPQFPPDSFKGFAVINAAEDKINNKVVVKIYVDEGTKLFPYYMNEQLWVKVGN